MKITSQELRNKFLEFFRTKGHAIIPSAPLVPDGDSSVLFTTAGMHPLVPYLLGQEHPAGSRLANVQKCVRTGDIEEVGDDTHLTFFEMMGNWSLGDYFKREAISWSFEFLTSPQWLGLPLERLAFTCFAGDQDAPRDEESAAIWKSLGVPESRITFLPKEKNWWIAGTSGPCGPDTEMHYWIDDGVPVPATYDPNDPRWVEIWNDVFMEFEQLPDGRLIPLKKKNVDTGMGLDRVLAALNGHRSVYDTELFKPLFEVLAFRQEIMSNDEIKRAKIILDHVRAAVFMAGDSVEPSNKDRGYVMRRLLRRSMVYARILNLQDTWLKALIGRVIASYAQAYPELVADSERIFGIICGEQSKFSQTLEKGLGEFEKLSKRGVLGGADAFDLYQTYGFPWELSEELARAAGHPVDRAEFEQQFKKHQELSRTASAGQFKGGLASHSEKIVRLHTATHLLNAALRRVLGEEVLQKGSNITDQRTRFDFSHGRKLTPEEISAVQALVNDWIARDLAVKKEIMPLSRARELQAVGVFEDKYAQTVSVYTVLDPGTGEVISRELCGGPHVERTGTIGDFSILKEEASSSGVRRIKATVNP